MLTGLPKPVLLVMDFQHDIVAMTAAGGSAAAVERVRVAIDAARGNSIPIIFVRVAYRASYVDAAVTNKRVSTLREKGLLLEDAIGSQFVPDLALRPGDPIVVKRRASALAYTDLSPLLRGYDAESLLVAGIATSGVVLSTVRQAADADYRICVLEDACADADTELHRVLVTKVFPQQAIVTKVDDFVRGLK